MKRFLIFLGILFSSVFITGRVNASEISQFCEYTEPCLTTEFIKEQLAKDINNQIGYYDQDDIAYIIAASKSSITDYKSIKFYVYRKSRIKFDKQDLQTGDVYYNSYTGNFEIKVDRDGYLLPFINGSIELSTNEKINLSDFSEKIKFEYITRSTTYSILGTRNTNYAYFTNIDLLDSEGNVAFAKNDDKVVEKQTVFDDVIYGTKYSKVELVFDIKGNVEQSFNFKYDFHLLQSNGKLDEYNTFSSPYFIENASFCSNNSCSIPNDRYFRILPKYIYGSSEIDNDYVYKEIDKSDIDSSNSNSYRVNNYDLSINDDPLTKVTSSFKLVIDLTFDSSLIVDSFFQSSIPFTVNYIERDNNSSSDNYYSTIDLTGKYGILFIPKIESSVTGINNRTLFQGIGHLDIQHRSSYDPNNYEVLSAYSMNYCNNYLSLQKEIPYSCNSFNGSFEFYITNDMLNQSLFFINTVYTNDLTSKATVTYDTRYYVYYVYDTPDTEITIKNPNTGEDFNLSLKDFFNYVEEKEELKISIYTFLKPIKFILTSITDFYNNYCPAVVQKFLYISFMFVVVLIVIKIIW